MINSAITVRLVLVLLIIANMLESIGPILRFKHFCFGNFFWSTCLKGHIIIYWQNLEIFFSIINKKSIILFAVKYCDKSEELVFRHYKTTRLCYDFEFCFDFEYNASCFGLFLMCFLNSYCFNGIWTCGMLGNISLL